MMIIMMMKMAEMMAVVMMHTLHHLQKSVGQAGNKHVSGARTDGTFGKSTLGRASSMTS